MNEAQPETIEQLLRALLALEAADRDERAAVHDDVHRSELVLSDAGFTPGQIAAVLGRNREAVKSTVRRARAHTK
jgi:DNA-directed RNA polymerase specialized sigma24 family protein